MQVFEPLKPAALPRVGLYSIGLPQYWNQFPGLRDRLCRYCEFVANRLGQWATVTNAGMVDSEQSARAAAESFHAANVDLIFCHVTTYSTSASHVVIGSHCRLPMVLLNLQPAVAMDYESTTTGEWLAQCVNCAVPEIANAFNRASLEFHLVSGLLGLEESPAEALAQEATADHPEAIAAWKQIEQWTRAAGVARTLRQSRFGFLGHTYPGMLDMYSDFTMVTAQAGVHVEVLEMCDLEQLVSSVSPAEQAECLEQVRTMFELSEDSPSDPLARSPQPEQLEAASRVAVALERLVRDFNLDALAYYYRGRDGNAYEELQEALILGNSLLTAKGIPCSGEGDLKTALAMKISDLLGVGGSYSELVATDYNLNTIILGHDGPFHIGIAANKPILRGMGLYHGKWGTGVSVEATVRKGPVTMFNVTQHGDGRIHTVVNEGEAIDAPILRIGNTMTHVRFGLAPSEFMNKWFALAPTHHGALSIGHNANQLRKVAQIMDWPCHTVVG